MCGCLSHTATGAWPTTQARALTRYENRNSGSQACTQSTEPHQPGLKITILCLDFATDFVKSLWLIVCMCTEFMMKLLFSKINVFKSAFSEEDYIENH